MNPIAISALVVAIVANAAANILIKKAGGSGEGLAVYLNPWFIGGMFFFGVNLLAYTFALKTMPLSLAYPALLAGTLIIVALASTLALNEALSLPRLGGIAFILLGASLVIR